MSHSHRGAEDAELWMRHMRRGEFEWAWQLNDALRRGGVVAQNPEAPRHFQTVWDGTPVDSRRVLVRCYHGLGDTIQFIRYAPLLQSRAAALTVWVQPRLIPVLSTSMPALQLLPLHDGVPEVAHDVSVEIMELPYVFRTTVPSIPRVVPYLRVPPLALTSFRPAVGLVWRAGGWAAHRSIPFALLEPLTRVPISWYVLQGGEGLNDCPPGFGVTVGTNDLMEAARAIASLDLLITIDSMPAHLAGALGIPVWTLLPANADWRWMEGREDSPWYPSMRLFRQERPGDWVSVVHQVQQALETFVGNAAPRG